MQTLPVLCLLLTGATSAIPASAAVTNHGLNLDDSPRAGWLDRYVDARQGPEQVDRQVQTLPVGATGTLDLTGIAGRVQVTGGAGTDIRVEATKRVRHKDPAEARRLLSELRVEIARVGSRVEVRTGYPRRPRGEGDGASASVDYIVTVPAGSSASVRVVSGDISVVGVTGEVRAESISGNITASGTPNLAVAKTVSGNVTLRDIGTAAGLTVGTVSGTIAASGLRVRSLDCGSVSGDVMLSGLQAERVEAKSVSGNIVFDAPLSRGGRYEFTSHSGNVRVVMSGDAGFDLNASSFDGNIRTEVPLTVRSADGRSQGSRASLRRMLQGTAGDGSALLVIRTFSGTVVLAKK